MKYFMNFYYTCAQNCEKRLLTLSRPSVFRMERFGSNCKIFRKFNIWVPSKNLRDNCCKWTGIFMYNISEAARVFNERGHKTVRCQLSFFCTRQLFNYNEWRCAILPRHQLYLRERHTATIMIYTWYRVTQQTIWPIFAIASHSNHNDLYLRERYTADLMSYTWYGVTLSSVRLHSFFKNIFRQLRTSLPIIDTTSHKQVL
jgi:hypothetical protein